MPYCNCQTPSDSGPYPYVANVTQSAVKNRNFRTALWTGCYAQMTLMSIPVCSDIGMEIHEDTEQFIRIEQGLALVKMGECKNQLDFQKKAGPGDVITPAIKCHSFYPHNFPSAALSSVGVATATPPSSALHMKNSAGYNPATFNRRSNIFVPKGVWHNIINIGRIPLKLSSIYAPPHHPAGTVHATKEDAQAHY